MKRMYEPGAFGSGNFLPQPLGIVSWGILEMEVDTSKRLPAVANAKIPFDVKQNRYTNELRIVPHPGGQSEKTLDAGRRFNHGSHAFLLWIFCAFPA
jgi:hypothetical protein